MNIAVNTKTCISKMLDFQEKSERRVSSAIGLRKYVHCYLQSQFWKALASSLIERILMFIMLFSVQKYSLILKLF